MSSGRLYVGRRAWRYKRCTEHFLDEASRAFGKDLGEMFGELMKPGLRTNRQAHRATQCSDGLKTSNTSECIQVCLWLGHATLPR
jgi:hypothetical protein